MFAQAHHYVCEDRETKALAAQYRHRPLNMAIAAKAVEPTRTLAGGEMHMFSKLGVSQAGVTLDRIQQAEIIGI